MLLRWGISILKGIPQAISIAILCLFSYIVIEKGYDIATVYYDNRGHILPESMADGKSKEQIVSYGWKPGIAYRKSFNHSWKPIPKFSTDIAAAMELWEEMKDSTKNSHYAFDGPTVELKTMKGYILCLMWIEIAHTIHCKGETEDDAISGAWQLWKEG